MKRATRLQSLCYAASCILFITLLSGILLHLTVRDKWPVLSTIYYALPLPVLTAGWGGFLLLNFRSKFAWAFALLAAGACSFWWLSISRPNIETPPQSGTAKVKVLFWNMAHHTLPSSALEKLLNEYHPDIVGMVEAGHRHSDPNPLIANLPFGYNALKLPNAIAIIVKGQVKLIRQTQLPDHTKIVELEVVTNGQVFRTFIADVTAAPLSSREEPLAEIIRWAGTAPNTIVMGDFNTPLESMFFDEWKQKFHHAFNEAGHGRRETWPRWVPVLTIDHVWTSKDLTPVCTDKIWNSSSDHSALLVELK